MTTSQREFLDKVLGGDPIPLSVRAYFHQQARNELHELVLEEFLKQEHDERVTRAALARRIQKAPEQITRWLGAPGNWTIHTVVDLLLGMGAKLTFSLESLEADYAVDNLRQSQLDSLVPPLCAQHSEIQAEAVMREASAVAILEQRPSNAPFPHQGAPSPASLLGKIKGQPATYRVNAFEWRDVVNG